MAWKPCCDVYGTALGVQLYRIHVEVAINADNSEWKTLIDRKVDLCPRGTIRMEHYIERAVNPPTPKKKA